MYVPVCAQLRACLTHTQVWPHACDSDDARKDEHWPNLRKCVRHSPATRRRNMTNGAAHPARVSESDLHTHAYIHTQVCMEGIRLRLRYINYSTLRMSTSTLCPKRNQRKRNHVRSQTNSDYCPDCRVCLLHNCLPSGSKRYLSSDLVLNFGFHPFCDSSIFTLCVYRTPDELIDWFHGNQ